MADVHSHECPRCCYVWSHDRDTLVTEDDYDLAHHCEVCGEEQFMKQRDSGTRVNMYDMPFWNNGDAERLIRYLQEQISEIEKSSAGRTSFLRQELEVLTDHLQRRDKHRAGIKLPKHRKAHR